MAIVIGSNFKPFSYQEMAAPVQQATQAHQDIENAFGELDTKAGIWEGLANEQTDPVAYRTYMNYANDLRSKADMLAQQGLTPNSRRALNSMKARYASDIAPIEMAYKKRDELSKEQREYRMKNPTAIFDRDMSVASLDELISNPSAQYRSLSGKDIMAQVSEQAKNLSRQIRENPAKWKSILGNQYYELVRNTGFRDNEVMAAIMNSPNAQPELQKIINDTIASTGVEGWNNKTAYDAVRNYANQGLWSAIGTEDRKQLQNRAWDLAMKQKLMQQQAPEAPQVPFSRRPRAQVEIDESTTKMQKDLELIREAAKNPSLLNNYQDVKRPYFFPGATSEDETSYKERTFASPHYGAFQKWSEKAGSKDPKVIEQYINNEIKNSAKLYTDDIYTPADNKFLIKTLSSRLSYLKDADEKTDNIREYDPEDREVGKARKYADLEEFLNDSTVFGLDSDDNIVVTGKNSKGKVKSFALKPSVLDDSLRGIKMSDLISDLKRARIEQNSRAYMANRSSIFALLDAMNNDYSKVQGSTLGAKDQMPGEISYLDSIINP